MRMLQLAGDSTTSAELLLSRIRAKLEDVCREREGCVMPSDRLDKLRPLRFAQHLALAAQVLELRS